MKINPIKIEEDKYELYYENGNTMDCFIHKDSDGIHFISGCEDVGYSLEEIHAIYSLMSTWKRRLIEKDIREGKTTILIVNPLIAVIALLNVLENNSNSY